MSEKHQNVDKVIMMKTIFCAAFAAVLSACSPQTVQQNTENILTFQEQARVRAANDTMHISLVIQAQHADRKQAGAAVNRRLAALQEKIKQYKQLDVELGNRGVYPQYGSGNRITHWEDSAELRISGKDFEAVGQLIAQSENEAALRGIAFSVSPEARAKAVEQAGSRALDAVRQRASSLSRKMGFEDYRLLSIDLQESFEQQGEVRAAAYAQDAVAAEAAAPMAVSADQSGGEDIIQTARVTVQMK